LTVSQTKVRLAALRRHATSIGVALPVSAVLLLAPAATGPAESNPQTRTLSIVNMHTKERIAVTYKVNGRYDQAALKKLNYVLRDWRRNEVTAMDPKLFDLLWEVQREAGTNQPIHAVSGFRSPVTQAALRKRSRGVAKHSQHTLGKATDFYIPGVPVSRLREIAFRKQVGGVGYYPTSNTPFVHLDTGNVRSWPRMTRKQLLALFPDGKTLHLPADGKPLPGYNQALALAKAGQLGSGGSAPAQAKRGRNLLAALFDREDDEEETNAAAGREAPQSAPPPAIVVARAPAPAQVQPQAAVAMPAAAQQTAAASVAIPPARPPFAIASAPAQMTAPQAVEIAAAFPLPPLPAARPAAPKDVTEPLGAGAPALVAVALPTPRPHMDELPVVVAYAGDASATALGASPIDEVLRPGQGPAAMNARLAQARAPSNPYVAELPKPPAGARFSLMAGWSVAANLGTQHFVHPDQRIQPELLGAPSMLVANSFKPGYTVVGVAYAFSGAAIEPVAVHRFTQPDASATRVAGVR
jgi:uncharacterized protein YcbK (DUF882 family)